MGGILLLAARAEPASESRPTDALVQWDPDESYPWGSQYDSRLEAPVRLWRTAIPLADLFTEIKRQTGVKIGLWSLDDSSRELDRVRLNLYLNPRDPPQLRSLLAQLTWVLDLSVAYRAARPGAEVQYDLLCSDSTAGALDDLSRRNDAFWEAQKGDLESLREARGARLEEYHDALTLPSGTLAARYRGVDDSILFDLTDPPRRALVMFLFGLPAENILQIVHEGGTVVRWGSLTSEQRSLLATAFPEPASPVATVRVEDGGYGGGVIVSLERAEQPPPPPESEKPGWGLAVAPPIFVMRSPDTIIPDEALERAKGLGEVVTPADVEAFRQGLAQREADLAAALRAERRREAEARQQAGEALSSRMESRLSALLLPVAPEPGGLRLPADGRPRWALWELQQAVAGAAGVSIISDCFWQPRRPLLGPWLGETDAYAAALPQPTSTLTAIRGATFGGVDLVGDDLLSQAPMGDPVTRPAWEWGDAGMFLRFRSSERDLWRASLLPAEAVAQLDRAYGLSVGPIPPGRARAVSFDLKALAQLVGKLSDLQFLFGAHLLYGDPADGDEVARQAFREAVLSLPPNDRIPASIQGNVWMLRLLSTLTEEQWQTAATTGLIAGRDLTPDQQSMLRSGLSGDWAPTWAHRGYIRGEELARFAGSVLRAARAAPERPGLLRARVVEEGQLIYELSYDEAIDRWPPPGGPVAGTDGQRAP